jgi:hypothetical protein
MLTDLEKGLSELLSTHLVTSSVGDTIAQWHNAGGMVQYYDFPLDTYLNVSFTHGSILPESNAV